MMNRVVILYATAPDLDTAQTLARALIEERAAACVNIIPGMTSFYRWKDAVEEASETVMIVKTSATSATAARDLICSLHPYETPAILALNVDESASSAPFLQWIEAQTGAPE